jgi:histidine triad (HIT) family protein
MSEDSATDCVFCGIVAGDRPAHLVHETDHAVAFLDVNAVGDGHTLVVPRAHHERFTALSPETAGATFRAARTVAEALVEAFDPAGYNVIHSTGAAAGQDVAHAHVHVIPRAPDDDVRFAPPRRRLSEAEGDRIAAQLRRALPE